ncbi:MAG: DUF6596 domain-containing protein [Ilumatobacteraceae bacterium]
MRELAPKVLGALVRRYGHFDVCEDAVQLALLAAVKQWPADGIPSNPHGWLHIVATRRLIDQLRTDSARRERENLVLASSPPDAFANGPADESSGGTIDDTLQLLFLCCHPALSPPTQLALTLRAVGGLTTAEIARAFFVPEATMAQRISRAKATIVASDSRFETPADDEYQGRLAVVVQVLYLMFNEGYTATGGTELMRPDLSNEAIRLIRVVSGLRPATGEVSGLLALMLLTDARRSARTAADGSLIPLAEQDRSLWDQASIAEGVEIITAALASTRLGPYQLQAAIAAVHDEAPSSMDTDWPQICALYELLERVAPNPMATLNHAVAVAMARGARAGLVMLEPLDDDPRIADHHRLPAVRAHLLELAGDIDGARMNYRLAARRTLSLPERRHLELRAARLT